MDAKEASVDSDCAWVVHSCSSESRVHVAGNVLREELYLIWQTGQPTDEAWIILEASRPVAVGEIEIVNAGSSLVEVFGLREDREGEDEDEYEMLLPAQQIMTVRDLVNKSNRNRIFVYDIGNKLASLACQHRWRLINVHCKQPFGTDEHKACIGLSRLHITSCRTKEEMAAEAADTLSQQHMKTELAEMFPDEIRLGVKKVSLVTDPKILPGTQREFLKEDALDRSGTNPGGFATTPEKKRRLPVWGSSNDKKKMKEASEVKGSCSQERVQAKSSLDSVASMPSFVDRKGKNRIEPVLNEGAQGLVHDRGKAGSKGNSHLKTSSRVTKQEGQHALSNLFSSEPDNKSKCNSSKTASSVKFDKGEVQECQERELLFDGNVEQKRNDEGHEQGQIFHSRIESQQIKGRKVGNELHMDLKSKSSYRSGEPSTKRSMVAEADQDEFQQAGKMKTTRPFFKLLEGVIFAISGLVNPERADLRDKALEMGAQYRPDWSSNCTLLICAFANTPKFKQVKGQNGTIVSKDWIPECYQKRELVEIEPYILHAGNPWKNTRLLYSSDSKEDSSEEKDAFRTKLSSTKVHQVGKDQVQDHKRTLASLSDAQNWAQEDLTDTIKWLQQQEEQPDEKEIETIATQGILLCLDDAIKGLKERKRMKNILETWDFVPRAVKELVANEEQKAATRKFSREDLLHEAERFKWIYDDEYQKLKERGKQNTSFAKRKGKQLMEDTERDDGEDNGNDDDDATELMSDDGSRDAVNWESDETEVMDDHSVRQAWQSISSHIRR